VNALDLGGQVVGEGGSIPNGFSPSSASPESLRRIRLKAGFLLAAMMDVSVSLTLDVTLPGRSVARGLPGGATPC